LNLRQYHKALLSYEQAIHLKPDNAATHHHKGFVLQQLGRLEEAYQAYAKAKELGY